MIPYFSDICPKRSDEIIVGYESRNAKEYINESEINLLDDEGFIIKTTNDNNVICGKTSRGTLYGVYTFLENFLGFRAFAKDIEKIDYVKDFSVEEINITQNPDFEYRDAYFRGAFDGEFAPKMRLNTSVADISRGKGSNMKFSALIILLKVCSRVRFILKSIPNIMPKLMVKEPILNHTCQSRM